MSNRSLHLSFPMPALGQSAGAGLMDWCSYLALDEVLTGRGFRIRFLKGTFEIMSISKLHEQLKSIIGILVQEFCDARGIHYSITGSATQRVDGVAGAEPDESFTFGSEDRDRPDLVIEVGLSSGGIDKCELWAELGARELWVWEKDRLHAFALESGTAVPLQQSAVLPGIDLVMLAEVALIKPTSAAKQAFRQRLVAL
jgi:Uma2 family endonuclease